LLLPAKRGPLARLSEWRVHPLTATMITIELSHSQDMALPILAASLLASSICARIAPVPLHRAVAQRLLDGIAPLRDTPK
jgi:H+/Cl- antiporter ClcA